MNFLSRQYESLSGRDRKLIAGMLVFFSTGFVIILLVLLNSWLTDRAATIQQQKDKYEMLVALRAEYAEAHQVVLDARETMAKHKGKTPSAFLESTASSVGVREALTVSKQGGEEDQDGVTATNYKVVLKRIQLEEAVNFLYDVETSGYPLAVDSADFKTSSLRGEKVMTLTIEAVHYEFPESAG